MQILPVDARGDSPNFKMTIVLDFGVPYVFEFRWNARDSAWYFNMYEQDETPIVSGVKVVLGTYLGRRSNHPFFRIGVLVAVDTSGQGLDAGLDDLGGRVQLRRYTAQEIIQGRQGFIL